MVLVMVLLLPILCSCGLGGSGGNSLYPAVNFREKPVTITYMTIGDKPTNGRTEEVVDKINKILEKEINARLDIFYVSWTDYLENYNKTLREERVNIDLVGTGTDWLDAWPNVINGNFLPMSEEMIRTYCPRTYANVTSAQWEACKYNGDIYFIPENEYLQWTNHGFIYRGDIARKAGLDSVDTWEDLTEYFRFVRENYPDMIPWDASGDVSVIALGYLMSKTHYVPIYEVTNYGVFGGYSNLQGTLKSPFYKGDELVEFAKLMREWSRIGVFRPDNSTSGDNPTEFLQGITSVDQHHTQKFFMEIKPSLELSQAGADAKFFWFGKESGNLLRTSILHGAMAVSAGSENPEKALMVYDYLRNDEACYRLIRYGIEGIQYEINEEGMLENPSGYNPDQDSITTNFWWGRRDALEIPDSGAAWDDYNELVKEYEQVAMDYPWDVYPFATANISERVERINEVCARYLPEIIYGRYHGTPEEEVAAFREDLRLAGYELVTKELQKILDSH